ASMDRITNHETKFVELGSGYYRQTSVYGYPLDSSAVMTMISREQERLTDFGNETVPGHGSQWMRAQTRVFDGVSPTISAVTRKEFLNRGDRKVWSTSLRRGETNPSIRLAVDGLVEE